MRKMVIIAVASLGHASACYPTDPLPMPPRPTDPISLRSMPRTAYAPQEILDASVVRDAEPLRDTMTPELDSGALTLVSNSVQQVPHSASASLRLRSGNQFSHGEVTTVEADDEKR